MLMTYLQNGGMEKKLEEFLTHLNNLSQHIKFTIEMEEDGKLPFLDVLLTKKENGETRVSSVQKEDPH
jgi:hypothetical protein